MSAIDRKFAIIIQARMGSSRLPGKVMLKLGESTLIGFLLKRLFDHGFSKNQICVATTSNPLDEVLYKYLVKLGFKCIRGSESDVLSRYQKAATFMDVDHVVRLTGDNPFVDTNLIDYCIEAHCKSDVDLTSTRFINGSGKIERTFPKGFAVDIIKTESLLSINSSDCTDFEREHVVPFFFSKKYQVITKGEIITKLVLDHPVDFTVDTLNDYVKLLTDCKLY